VTIQGSVTDADGDLAQAWLEIEDEYGELDGTQDVTAALGPDGAFVTSVTLIARRDGKDKDGREYVITLYAVDAAGNEAASDSITVVVPHDQGKGR